MGMRLHIRVPDASVLHVDLLDGVEVLVGRSAECAVVVPHATLSARHASIRSRAGRVEVRDEGSRFGTQIGTAALPAGDWRDWAPGEPLWLGDVAAAWEHVDDDPTVLLDPSGVQAPDDGALWSVAMDRDAADRLASPPTGAPDGAGPQASAGSTAFAMDSGAGEAVGPGPALAGAGAPGTRPASVPAVPDGVASRPAREPAPVPAARARVSVAMRSLAAAAGMVCLGAAAFALWVLLG